MKKVVSVATKNNFVLSVTFEDGLKGDVSLSDRMFGPVFEPLTDPDFFSQAVVDQFGVVTWPNGADLDPNALYAKVVAQNLQKAEVN